jgi:hypothetical protein
MVQMQQIRAVFARFQRNAGRFEILYGGRNFVGVEFCIVLKGLPFLSEVERRLSETEFFPPFFELFRNILL